MLFPRHPRLMSDNELSALTKSLIDRKAPESNYLDYKAEICIQSKSKKIEIAKDITSFANENGGLLLYGVPERPVESVPIPENLSKCGISIPEDLPTNIENILIDTVQPSLPELTIKILRIPELGDKVLLMIHHPESWNKPHMVEGYREGRYYRRGNFRTIIMTEKQVEAAYNARKMSLLYVKEFFNSGDFREIPNYAQFMRVIICPRFYVHRKDLMYSYKFEEWLGSYHPHGRQGEWVLFLDGWAFKSHASGGFHGQSYEIRLFHNGGYSYTTELTALLDNTSKLDLSRVSKYIEEYVFDPYLKIVKGLRISCPLSIQFSLHNVKGLEASIPASQIYETFEDEPRLSIENDTVEYIEETSVTEIMTQRNKAIFRLTRRLASAFGKLL